MPLFFFDSLFLFLLLNIFFQFLSPLFLNGRSQLQTLFHFNCSCNQSFCFSVMLLSNNFVQSLVLGHTFENLPVLVIANYLNFKVSFSFNILSLIILEHFARRIYLVLNYGRWQIRRAITFARLQILLHHLFFSFLPSHVFNALLCLLLGQPLQLKLLFVMLLLSESLSFELCFGNSFWCSRSVILFHFDSTPLKGIQNGNFRF